MASEIFQSRVDHVEFAEEITDIVKTLDTSRFTHETFWYEKFIVQIISEPLLVQFMLSIKAMKSKYIYFLSNRIDTLRHYLTWNYFFEFNIPYLNWNVREGVKSNVASWASTNHNFPTWHLVHNKMGKIKK